MAMWTLDDGLGIVRALQPLTRKFNYHLCLGGGVLNNGSSDKDLDLYFLPLAGQEKVEDANLKLIELLNSLWGPAEIIGGVDYEDEGVETKYLHKLKFNRGDDRIDVFIL